MAATNPLDTGILLEAGTNEFEVLVFFVRNQAYGVNVAKVREVLNIADVTVVPRSHPAVEGMVRIRNDVVTLIDLEGYLHGERLPTPAGAPSLMLLLEFNNQLLGFRVSGVDRIVRASWSQGKPMPAVAGAAAPVTSVVLLKDKMLLTLDFESIAANVGVSTAEHHDKRSQPPRTDVHNLPIVFAEDSQLIREMIREELSAAGFTNLYGFVDGKDAWDHLCRVAEGTSPENVRDCVSAVITDVEMPRVDGLNLTKRIREHAVLKDIPVVIFSSLVSRDNEKKGQQVGASAQVPKPKYRELAKTLANCLQPA